jgi:hypothetical protein
MKFRMRFLPDFIEFACGGILTSTNLRKRAQITFGAVAKGKLLPLRSFCMRYRELRTSADFAIPMAELKLKLKNGGKF